jgi:hypothetical protein
MPWHRVKLSIERTATGDGIRLMDEATELFLAAEFPQDAAVFGISGEEGGFSSQYFNPGASRICADLLERWDARQCEDPGTPVALLLGNPNEDGNQDGEDR